MKSPFRLLLCSLVTAAALSSHATSPIEEVRNLWKEWSNVKATISEERNAWAREQQAIADALAVSTQEIELLTSRLSTLDDASSGTEQARSELLEKIAASKTQVVIFNEAIDRFENAMRSLVPALPPHLRTELGPVLMRLPAAGRPNPLPVSQRLQTVVAFLAQLDRFNSTPSLVSEVREVEPGRSMEVRTLYFGLGIAYFSDPSAQYAGFGQPSADGWTWTRAEGPAALRIADAIAVQRNEKQPAFVSLPARLAVR
ncbi:MAG: DUF3450 family protein [Verrucomicrobiae bacterium]|nr:DUF3450 family protein [Verrucomicrobiae bacterium]